MTAVRINEAVTSRGSRADAGRHRTTALALLTAALFAAAAWIWFRGAETRAVRHLPLDERRALYERTVSTLRNPCGLESRPAGLDAFCRAQAEFALEFPECDASCEATAKRFLASPVK